MAYGIESYQLQGPDWMLATRFDIAARLPQGGARSQIPAMLQALLADRFQLAVRRETKEETVFVLEVGKNGPNMQPGDPQAAKSSPPIPNGPGAGPVIYRILSPDGPETISRAGDRYRFWSANITMHDFAARLMRFVDLPVVDFTGLTGWYQVSFDVPPPIARRAAMADGAPSGQPSEPSGVSLFAAVQKLGLHLEKRKAPVEHIVVEHVEGVPTEN